VLFEFGPQAELRDVESEDQPNRKINMKMITIDGVPLELLEIGEVAKSLGVSVDTVRREIWRKHLGQFKLANRIYIKKSQLETYLAGCEHPAAETEGATTR
jgi:excisionase family DNA binding protein